MPVDREVAMSVVDTGESGPAYRNSEASGKDEPNAVGILGQSERVRGDISIKGASIVTGDWTRSLLG